MKHLESSQDKIQNICDSIRRETLEPAEQEAKKIIEAAKIKAQNIVEEAEDQRKRMFAHAKVEIEQKRNVFHSSLRQAEKQSIESLRQELEKIFNTEIESVVAEISARPTVIADTLTALINAVNKDGTESNLEAVISESASSKEIAALLTENILNQLKKHPIAIGKFAGGAQLKLVDKKIRLDMTDATLKELLENYVRRDLRKFFFSN